MKNRYFVEIAFNGTHYFGWQKQPAHISVQEVCNQKISTILGENINCNGCGRTDSGVHALKFFFHFDTIKTLDHNFIHKLNSFFPQDILVKNIYSLTKKIHARWDALSRSYEYLISPDKDPFRREMVLVSHEHFDIDRMNAAAAILKEYPDFESFSKTNNSHNHYLCDVTEAFWVTNKNLLVFRISSNRFLRSMVRLIVGSLLEVGKGKITPEDFRGIIEAKDRRKSGKAVPACGLYLVDVVYPANILKTMNENSLL